MALIKSVRGFTPEIGENCFLADNATIIGDVKMGRDCSIWFSTVLRGDVNSIRIGNGVNIQDGSVLHTLYEKSTIEIGDHVSVGHNVTIHGAAIRDYALIGMGSTILDHAVVGEGAIVAAGSLVLSNTVIEPGSIWGGVPAKFIKKVDPEQAKELNQKIAHNYLMYSSWYKEKRYRLPLKRRLPTYRKNEGVTTHSLRRQTFNLKLEHPKRLKKRVVSLLSKRSLIRPF